MISTLVITIVIESALVTGYSLWRKKPLYPILFTSIGANVITQSFLLVMLTNFFQNYLVTLFLSEVVIWLIEGIVFCYIPFNGLDFKDAILLSFSINLSSFVAGWFLPV